MAQEFQDGFKKFKDGFTNLKDGSGPGQPKTGVTNANIGAVTGARRTVEKLPIVLAHHQNQLIRF